METRRNKKTLSKSDINCGICEIIRNTCRPPTCVEWFRRCLRRVFIITGGAAYVSGGSTYASLTRTRKQATEHAKMWNRKQQSLYIIISVSLVRNTLSTVWFSVLNGVLRLVARFLVGSLSLIVTHYTVHTIADLTAADCVAHVKRQMISTFPNAFDVFVVAVVWIKCIHFYRVWWILNLDDSAYVRCSHHR